STRSRWAAPATSTPRSARSSGAASGRRKSPTPSRPWWTPISPIATGMRKPSSRPIGGWGLPRSRRRFMAAMPRQPDAEAHASQQAAALQARHGEATPQQIIAAAAAAFPGALAAVSSFGADSAVLLHMIAGIDPALPVIFLDTGQHFGETLAYRDELVADLGLTGLRIVHPLAEALAAHDPEGTLHRTDTDACCGIRKVEPMDRAVAP